MDDEAYAADVLALRLLKQMPSLVREGIIAKRLDAPHKGTRDESWLKISFVTRAGSGREIGNPLLRVNDEQGRLRYAGSVGTGWDSTLAAAILRQLERIETDAMPFDTPNTQRRRGAGASDPPAKRTWGNADDSMRGDVHGMDAGRDISGIHHSRECEETRLR